MEAGRRISFLVILLLEKQALHTRKAMTIMPQWVPIFQAFQNDLEMKFLIYLESSILAHQKRIRTTYLQCIVAGAQYWTR